MGLDAKLIPPKSRATPMDGDRCSEPASTSASSPPKMKRTKNYSETMWPKRVKREEANTLQSKKEGQWDFLESVTILGKTYHYMEQKECDYDLTLCHSTFKIKSSTFKTNLPCRPLQDELYRRAKFLYEQVIALPNMKNETDIHIACHARAARPAEPDSDGEDIIDHAIVPQFDEVELGIIRYCFRSLYNAYVRVMTIGLCNCVGKQFLDALGQYADLCTRPDVTTPSSFMYLHNTSIGRVQPGAMYVNWLLTTTSSTGVKKTVERYADNVMYDKINHIYVIVGEVKDNATSSIESHNNEQMLGLWKGPQQAMLGLEARGSCVRPKVLLLYKGVLHMCYIKELHLAEPTDLLCLVKLIMVFLICVDYYSPSTESSDSN